mmetsp:Transcript_32116/g.36520  ORF Transcript_32116/g.36520 Transcript_32116/m.36520 type:complete len:100 (+) Transcript_32116:1261-1560(+)
MRKTQKQKDHEDVLEKRAVSDLKIGIQPTKKTLMTIGFIHLPTKMQNIEVLKSSKLHSNYVFFNPWNCKTSNSSQSKYNSNVLPAFVGGSHFCRWVTLK